MARKRSTKVVPKEKSIRLPISKLIDTKFREYAVYVLESRGIPNFYDALTPVQRYILMNSPSTLTKTLSVVGKSIEDGYHHGDMSLGKAISKLARPFGSSIQILEGYGFFGTEVSPDPAAARYTQIKVGKKPLEILKKYKHLFTRIEEGAYDPFWMDVPLGLTTGIVGIAVGYKSTILPRKLTDIQEFLAGKRKNVKPYFQDFNGTVTKYNNLDKSWLISSKLNITGNRIEIRELPPVLKYTATIKKLDWLFNKFAGDIRVIDNSKTKVCIDVVYSGKSKEVWKEIQNFTSKIFSVIVTENPVFIKDSKVLVYDRVEDYLTDYQWQILKLDARNKEYNQDWTDFELEFNKAKKLFIAFLLAKKRSVEEIDVFMKSYSRDIKSRLEALTAKKFTSDELAITTARIKELEKELATAKRLYKAAQKLFDKTPDPTNERGIASRRSSADLFDTNDITEDDGILIWTGEDPFDKETGDLGG